MRRTTAALGALGLALCALPAATSCVKAEDAATVASVNQQPYMNVFRRFEAPSEEMFAFYRDVIGLPASGAFTDVGAGGVYTFSVAGASQFKLTRRTPDRAYVDGGVADATGLRLVTFYVADASETDARFEAHGLPAPQWRPIPGETRSAAMVEDPDGQPVELIAAPGEGEDILKTLEVGLVVSDLTASRSFYADFVGLDPTESSPDPILGVERTSFRHGSTIVNLMTFGADLPADTGSGGIQYVVRDAALVDRLGQARGVAVETPLSTLPGYNLTTVWLNDPDGITNYFAQLGGRPAAEAAGD